MHLNTQVGMAGHGHQRDAAVGLDTVHRQPALGHQLSGKPLPVLPRRRSNDADHKHHSTSLRVLSSLPPGFGFIVASYGCVDSGVDCLRTELC